MQLRFHIFMCRACKGFQKQNEALLYLFDQRFRESSKLPGTPRPELPPNACERLKQILREAESDHRPSE
tara:strand:- start:305 stop:511 length:207 start_codon:yes stop_codon:yes gene_type:complete